MIMIPLNPLFPLFRKKWSKKTTFFQQSKEKLCKIFNNIITKTFVSSFKNHNEQPKYFPKDFLLHFSQRFFAPLFSKKWKKWIKWKKLI